MKRIRFRNVIAIIAIFTLLVTSMPVLSVFCKYKFPKVASKNGENCISILEKVAGCAT